MIKRAMLLPSYLKIEQGRSYPALIEFTDNNINPLESHIPRMFKVIDCHIKALWLER